MKHLETETTTFNANRCNSSVFRCYSKVESTVQCT